MLGCVLRVKNSAMDEEERGWILGSQKGDQDAFESLIKRYQKMIHALTFRMTGTMADAEDLAQETFIHAFRNIGLYRGESAFSSWLYRIALNLCLNWRRREARRREVHEDWRADDSGGQEGDHALADNVRYALMKLDPKQRAAVVLTVYDGHNHAEAARLLGCSEATVSWRIFAARRKLKKWLSKAGRGNEGI